MFIISLISFFAIGLLSADTIQAVSDTTAPQLVNFTCDKTVVHAGDTITYTLDIKEDGTGVTAIEIKY